MTSLPRIPGIASVTRLPAIPATGTPVCVSNAALAATTTKSTGAPSSPGTASSRANPLSALSNSVR